MQFVLELRCPSEKGSGFLHGHVEDVSDVLAAVANLQDIGFEPLALADLAGGIDILEEVHFQFFDAAAFAPFAATTCGIERKVARRESLPLRVSFRGEELADLIERFQVGNRVRSWGAADRLLIDHADTFEIFDTFDGLEPPHGERLHTKGTGHGSIESIFNQGAFP